MFLPLASKLASLTAPIGPEELKLSCKLSEPRVALTVIKLLMLALLVVQLDEGRFCILKIAEELAVKVMLPNTTDPLEKTPVPMLQVGELVTLDQSTDEVFI